MSVLMDDQKSARASKELSKVATIPEWMLPKRHSSIPSRSLRTTLADLPSRLPLYGPLNVKNIYVFYREARDRFEKMYQMPCPYLVIPTDFEPQALLGKGAFGKVLLVKDKRDNVFYAMKACEKRHLSKMKQVPHALNEKRVLQCLDFPFAVRMEFFAKDNSYIYFFMPFVSGGEMFNHLQRVRRFTENQAKFYAAQVVLGLEYLHFLKLCYRDLKPENLLLDHYGYLKITDFGFCKQVTSRTYTFCGTPHYLAPEIITGHGYAFSCDWWSLGVLIYEMCAGHPPFDNEDQMMMFRLIIAGRYAMPPMFAAPLRDIISKLLQVDVTRRYGVLRRGAEDVKSHEWFKTLNWLEIFNRRVAAPFVPQTKGGGDVSQFPVGAGSAQLDIATTNEFEDEFKDF